MPTVAYDHVALALADGPYEADGPDETSEGSDYSDSSDGDSDEPIEEETRPAYRPDRPWSYICLDGVDHVDLRDPSVRVVLAPVGERPLAEQSAYRAVRCALGPTGPRIWGVVLDRRLTAHEYASMLCLPTDQSTMEPVWGFGYSCSRLPDVWADAGFTEASGNMRYFDFPTRKSTNENAWGDGPFLIWRRQRDGPFLIWRRPK